MPGFIVNTLGEGVPSSATPYYSYAWEIEQLFGTNIETRTATIYAKDCTLPTFTSTREDVEGSSLVYKHASMVTWEDVRVTFYDSFQLSAKLRSWRREVWTADGGIAPADNYKHDSKLIVFGMNEETAKQKKDWHLYGSWPQSIREGELTYTNTDIKVVEVIVCYDWADEKESTSSAGGLPPGGGYLPDPGGFRG